MSLARVILVTVQAVCNGLACTPPNPTPQNRRYHTEEMYILQIAPLIFKIHHIIAYLFAIFEILFYLRSVLPFPSPLPQLTSLICTQQPQPTLTLTPSFLLGILAVLLGTYIRLDCFKTLGELFTFDLTIHPSHKLITTRFYAYVRHPAYTGSLLLVFGLAFTHLTQGSWVAECGGGLFLGGVGEGLRKEYVRGVVWASWWAWTFCVGISRADAEDRQMRRLFKEEWDAYAAAVHWWFFPGLI
ncbi:hypothetical protein M413DRAFT_13673 [Hebeloma cylindrosporum]|uniref:Protein-S-isoprenylcysteine O-methyltransferase n=1 Tax=Hebeloma cylindrosporum TaxID=76867 RepID=A0A0C2XG78_HEBCY|nr:hypothetical protein M413DRAFT_13673 [Hebeloma cylindrosporum h7]